MCVVVETTMWSITYGNEIVMCECLDCRVVFTSYPSCMLCMLCLYGHHVGLDWIYSDFILLLIGCSSFSNCSMCVCDVSASGV